MPSASRRIACLWFPHWALERRRALAAKGARATKGALPAPSDMPGDPERPFVLVREGSHGLVIHDADEAALACGLRPGGRLADAMGRIPDLTSAPADPHADRAALDEAAEWCRRWTPHVRALGGEWGDAAILLDTTGCDHLHGGEAPMLEEIAELWHDMGYGLRIALAPTVGAARALARHAPQTVRIVPEGGLEAALDPLPAVALGLDGSTAVVLSRLGLKTIGQLRAVPRKALARRFSPNHGKSDRDATWEDLFARGAALPRGSADGPVPGRERTGSKAKGAKTGAGRAGGGVQPSPLVLLDRALGTLSEPLSPTIEEEPALARVALLEPIDDAEAVRIVLEGCIHDLCTQLEKRSAGARSFALAAFRVDGTRESLLVRASTPTRDPGHVMRLFTDRVEAMEAEFGFDAFTLEAEEVEGIDAAQSDLSGREDGREGMEATGIELSRLIDLLSGRLGPRAVLAAMPVDSHWPERAEAWVPAMGRLTELTLAARGPERSALQGGTAGAAILDAPTLEVPARAVPAGQRETETGEAGKDGNPSAEAEDGAAAKAAPARTDGVLTFPGTKPVTLRSVPAMRERDAEKADRRETGEPQHHVPSPAVASTSSPEILSTAALPALPSPSPVPSMPAAWLADESVTAMPVRPERLLAPPERIEVLYALPDGPPARFRWRRVIHRVVRHAGPERIAPEWWRERGDVRARDYYRVEDEEGCRFWIFRQGLYDDGRGGAPEWFCHGLFS